MKFSIVIFALFLCGFCNGQNTSNLVKAKFKTDKMEYVLVFKNSTTYNLLKNWEDKEITKKYTGVKGINSFILDRKEPGQFYASISKINAAFLIKNYLNFTSEDTDKILNAPASK